MEPNPYESPKELDPAPKIPEGATPRWRWDHTQLLLGAAGTFAGCISFLATVIPPDGNAWEFRVTMRVAAAILLVMGVVLMWGPISRHEDAAEDDNDETSNS